MDLDDDEDGYYGSKAFCDVKMKIVLSEQSINLLQFYRNILSPFIESYWLAACSLLKLVGKKTEDKIFFRDMIDTANERLIKGLLRYGKL